MRSWRWRRVACAPMWALALGGLLGLGASPGAASALTLGFDDAPSLSDAAAFPFPGVHIGGALVVSEADAATLTGLPQAAFSSLGGNGLLNLLAPDGIGFDFGTPVSDFSVDVLALYGDQGKPQQVLLQAFRGAALVASDVSDTSLLGGGGLPLDRLAVTADGITRVLVSPISLGSCGSLLCATLGPSSSFLLDDASFSPIPEPGSVLLLAAGLLGLALRRPELG